jgi:hypothetical protein
LSGDVLFTAIAINPSFIPYLPIAATSHSMHWTTTGTITYTQNNVRFVQPVGGYFGLTVNSAQIPAMNAVFKIDGVTVAQTSQTAIGAGGFARGFTLPTTLGLTKAVIDNFKVTIKLYGTFSTTSSYNPKVMPYGTLIFKKNLIDTLI